MTILSYIFFQNSEHSVFELQELHSSHTKAKTLFVPFGTALVLKMSDVELLLVECWKFYKHNVPHWNKLEMNYCFIMTGVSSGKSFLFEVD